MQLEKQSDGSIIVNTIELVWRSIERKKLHVQGKSRARLIRSWFVKTRKRDPVRRILR